MKNETPEQIILRYSHRGMAQLASTMPENYCRDAARRIFDLPRGRVLLVTGLHVNGAGNTDGPSGTACLATVLEQLGFICTVLADDVCRGYFEPMDLMARYYAPGAVDAAALLDELEPVAIISIEHCGKNANGRYLRMNGEDVTEQTAWLDELFPLARERGIFTLGVGDGGNEIGMAAARQCLGDKTCTVETDVLIPASVSNWGGYALATCLEVHSGRSLMPGVDWLEFYLGYLTVAGCVDGVLGRPAPSVDGMPRGTEGEIFDALLLWSEHARAEK